ncbi:hypothetical protein QFC19_001594 [Naganishia cerealis]|uniref:Uncharacterized protein n=1 Tax=Naganishia cerealis TaxID=610337 RepID=A0ACC2WFF2_9TREE|nr:hypothetical protein QFC19_001594 [Naganishia cerealis]
MSITIIITLDWSVSEFRIQKGPVPSDMVQILPPRNGEPSKPSAISKPAAWKPSRYLEPSQPPRDEIIKKEQYEAALRASELWGGGVDFAGRPPKLLKPRRTVDYMSGAGRYQTLRKLRAGLPTAPVIHPGPNDMCNAHDHPIYALTYTHSGQFFVSADNSGALKYFTPTINNLTTIQAHREACRSISFSPNDEKFATGGDDGAIKIWTFGEAKEEKVLSGHGWDVRSLEWHPSKGLIVSGSKDLLVKFWDPRLGKDISTFPDGNLVATAGGEGLIRLFDIRTFKELEPLKGHKEPITVRFWCRARPQGGQEMDRWHVGDSMSQSLGVAKWQQRADEEEQDEDMPLPGLATAPIQQQQPSQVAPSNSTFSLPGLSVPMPAPTLPPPGMASNYGNTAMPSLPGFMPTSGPGGLRRGQPLPSQQDMLNSVGAPPPGGGENRFRGRRNRWGPQ